MKRVQLIWICSILFSVFLTANTFAQEQNKVNSGSFYSGIGFGNPVDQASPFTMGMGLSGVSNYYGLSTNISNPAHWGLTGYTQATISAGFDTFYASDVNSSAQNSIFGINQFQFVFPILRNRLGISASITPTVRGDFKKRSSGLFNPVPGQGLPVRYDFTSNGTGGVSRFELGLGYALSSNISVGYAFSANVFSMNTTISPEFSQSQFRAVNFNRKMEGYSMGHRFGVYAFTRNLLREDDQLGFGATLTLPVEIETEQLVTAFRVVNNQRRLIDYNENSPNRNGLIKLPLEFNTGLTYNLSRFVNVDAELLIQKWSDALYSFDTTQQNYFKDRMKTGLGVQYHPYRSDQMGGLFSNLKYGLGVTYDTGHLEINGQEIETIYLNAGIGLMALRSASSVDLSFYYGIRGTESASLVKENIWGFKLSLNLAEWMFVRQRFQ